MCFPTLPLYRLYVFPAARSLGCTYSPPHHSSAFNPFSPAAPVTVKRDLLSSASGVRGCDSFCPGTDTYAQAQQRPHRSVPSQSKSLAVKHPRYPQMPTCRTPRLSTRFSLVPAVAWTPALSVGSCTYTSMMKQSSKNDFFFI